MYKTIVYFTDLQDNGYVYNVGDTFPREGAYASRARIASLASDNNLQGKPLIEEVKEAETSAEATTKRVRRKKDAD